MLIWRPTLFSFYIYTVVLKEFLSLTIFASNYNSVLIYQGAGSCICSRMLSKGKTNNIICLLKTLVFFFKNFELLSIGINTNKRIKYGTIELCKTRKHYVISLRRPQDMRFPTDRPKFPQCITRNSVNQWANQEATN